jgi:hypothetical protein
MISIIAGLHNKMGEWPSEALSAALIGVAILLILIAVFSDSPLFKAGILAWVVLP